MTKKRAKRQTGSSGGGGLMTGMRTGMKNLAGTGGAKPKGSPKSRVLEMVLWAIVIGLLIYLLANRLG
ncbi:MAG: hypothetical protein RBU45_02335 [Myxococcota bacterium]|jgi:hypothetical protein|nr:hypothetical protein [Myxococcota bacterium]